MSGYISLNELPRTLEEGQEQGRTIAWQFEGGTSFDTTATELNLSRTEGAIRAFGFGGLIVRSFLGEQTSYGSGEMDVVGTNADGSAVGAAGGKVTRVDTVSSSL